MEGLKKKIRTATPEPGQHTDEILRSVGYSDTDIDSLRTRGII
jgi:crotonobetainyl-CoA:carnitine CoA-transferase CaiB-like acyl-CoA transferase